MTSENRDERKVPGLLEMLAQVPDSRKRRGRRYELVFVLAVAACCALAGAKTYREIGDQAADLPQDVLARAYHLPGSAVKQDISALVMTPRPTPPTCPSRGPARSPCDHKTPEPRPDQGKVSTTA